MNALAVEPAKVVKEVDKGGTPTSTNEVGDAPEGVVTIVLVKGVLIPEMVAVVVERAGTPTTTTEVEAPVASVVEIVDVYVALAEPL